jgi:hypothetical protein
MLCQDMTSGVNEVSVDEKCANSPGTANALVPYHSPTYLLVDVALFLRTEKHVFHFCKRQYILENSTRTVTNTETSKSQSSIWREHWYPCAQNPLPGYIEKCFWHLSTSAPAMWNNSEPLLLSISPSISLYPSSNAYSFTNVYEQLHCISLHSAFNELPWGTIMLTTQR